ncbi:MAG: hypothetical protein KJO27_02695 [Gammaproteobacteria bacterium]|nr:hypothetical protein [Gammaproteobacteria bacterium]NND46953.1 hypothetical protein [Woeseiaceae bacterium]NNL44316.1 hypothetical protein [Woeseiaceae bacterium]
MYKALIVVLIAVVTAAVSAASRNPLRAEAHIPGATLRIEVQQPIADEKAAEIIEWLRSASSNVSLAYGRFPSPSARIIVIPSGRRSWGGDSPVPFGRVTRDGEEKIELFVNPDRPIQEFYADWTATHEFSHLMLPYVRPRHKWISEGFASYYQNILMARAGHYTAREAWQKLYAGFERGRLSRPELSPNEAAAAGIRKARMKIYWSGAAIALLADIELRERSGGRESLDVALDRLQRCCLPSKRSWSGPTLFAKLDSLVDIPVFMPLYRQYADAAGFPDIRPALQRLGVIIENNSVSVMPHAELADLRVKITDGHARL